MIPRRYSGLVTLEDFRVREPWYGLAEMLPRIIIQLSYRNPDHFEVGKAPTPNRGWVREAFFLYAT